MTQLDKNYAYFQKHEKEFGKKYSNQYIVIVDEQVVYNSKSKELAIEYIKKLEAGTYILQRCDVDTNKNIQMFHTRVSF